MAGRTSRRKGAVAEREVASILREAGFSDARRTAQFCGNTGDASDVIGIPGYHLEVKRCERIELTDWLRQAEHDAALKDLVPTLIFRRSKEPWRVVISLDAFLDLLRDKATKSAISEAVVVGAESPVKNTAARSRANATRCITKDKSVKKGVLESDKE